MTSRLVLQPAGRSPVGGSCGGDLPPAGWQEAALAGNSRQGTRTPGRGYGSERPIAAIGLWCMMSLAATPAARAEPPNLEAAPRGAAGAPLVVHADAWEPPMASTEADILARRILQQPGSGFRLDPRKTRALAHEIERALSRIRDSHPVVKGVTVRERFDPWSLILGLEPDLYGKVSRAASLLSVEGGPVPLHTGHEPFDTLNAGSGLAAMELLSFMSSAVFYFNKPVHPFISPLQYSSVEGVVYAEPDFQLGDGPDVEVSRSQGIWYAVFRRAWGDCPSGCIESELFFFIVEEDEVERIESVQAMDMPMFAELVGRLEGAP